MILRFAEIEKAGRDSGFFRNKTGTGYNVNQTDNGTLLHS
jgi:hypothetical protein